jgi:hypothetical protein
VTGLVSQRDQGSPKDRRVIEVVDRAMVQAKLTFRGSLPLLALSWSVNNLLTDRYLALKTAR